MKPKVGQPWRRKRDGVVATIDRVYPGTILWDVIVIAQTVLWSCDFVKAWDPVSSHDPYATHREDLARRGIEPTK